jgi:hypothetical protein
MLGHGARGLAVLSALAFAAALVTAGAAGAATQVAAPRKAPTKTAARPPISPAAIAAVPRPAASTPAAASPRATAHDSSFTLKGGEEGTDFRTLTIEGEDRVHIEFDRPPVVVDLDPSKVPGLDIGSARDVLNRTVPDLVTPLTGLSSRERSPYLARPWLRQFASGTVAQFRPAVRGTERWKLLIANSRGQTVASFDGRGEPPKEITWDGRSQSGSPVIPGLTYSYVFEAYDRAGNKRNFVGQGFTVNAYRFDTPSGPTLACAAHDLKDPILLEIASWWNQANRPRDPVRVTATSRTYEEANSLAQRAVKTLGVRLIGDPSRVQAVAQVEPDSPEGGVLRVGPATGAASPTSAPGPVTPGAGVKSKKH